MSKLGDFDSYGADPRRIEKAGDSFNGVKVDYASKYKSALAVVKNNYETLKVPYYGLDNDDYVNGLGFCCKPATPTTATNATATTTSPTGKSTNSKADNAELQQYYYHPDHLGSSSYISNLDGEVVQHVEYVPFGEVFLEEKNAVWNTPYLFNGKELDKETGMSYYGARYYEAKTSVWISVDPLAEKGPEYSPYCYTFNNPINLTDPDGRWPDFPASFQSAFKGAVNTVKQKYNEAKAAIIQAKDNVVRTTNQALNNGQKFVKKHKEQLVAGAKFIQKTGDNMTTAGLTSAAVGAAITAPVGGEGGAPGLAFAGLGGAVSGVGKVIEVGVKFIAEDPEATTDGAKYVVGEMVGLGVNQIIPGPNPSATPFVKELIKIGKETTKTVASDKAVNTMEELKK